MLKKLGLFLLAVAVLLLATALITRKPLPDNRNRSPSHSLPADPQTLLGAHFLPQVQAHPGLSGIYPLREGRDAFLARVALAEAAQRSLDVQYYIWHDDVSGRLLLQSLYRAAERGVRVRLLLDDNNTGGMDGLLAALDAHANIEVRLFNPFMQRGFRPFGYLSDFFRLNRRMHNKSFTADGLVTIIGGRNVGDEYFGAGSGVMFADLDVTAIGPAAQAVGKDFDRYWASESSYPAASILQKAPLAFDPAPAQNAETQGYLAALAQSPFAHQLKTGDLPLEWAKATLVSDDPAKGLGRALPENTVLAHIGPVMGAAQRDLLIVSPYFVPTEKGTELLAGIARSGRRVSILTNALSATDVAAVHAGYAKYRKPLLHAGIQLFEMKPDATIVTNQHGGHHRQQRCQPARQDLCRGWQNPVRRLLQHGSALGRPQHRAWVVDRKPGAGGGIGRRAGTASGRTYLPSGADPEGRSAMAEPGKRPGRRLRQRAQEQPTQTLLGLGLRPFANRMAAVNAAPSARSCIPEHCLP